MKSNAVGNIFIESLRVTADRAAYTYNIRFNINNQHVNIHKYSAMDTPVQIEIKNVGTINIALDNFG